jgi:hypothetical protein
LISMEVHFSASQLSMYSSGAKSQLVYVCWIFQRQSYLHFIRCIQLSISLIIALKLCRICVKYSPLRSSTACNGFVKVLGKKQKLNYRIGCVRAIRQTFQPIHQDNTFMNSDKVMHRVKRSTINGV